MKIAIDADGNHVFSIVRLCQNHLQKHNAVLSISNLLGVIKQHEFKNTLHIIQSCTQCRKYYVEMNVQYFYCGIGKIVYSVNLVNYFYDPCIHVFL